MVFFLCFIFVYNSKIKGDTHFSVIDLLETWRENPLILIKQQEVENTSALAFFHGWIQSAFLVF